MKIIAIECDDGRFFISEQDCKSYNQTLKNLLIDGKNPEKSFCDDWFIVKKKPETIEKEIPQPNINHRFVLIDKSLENKKIKLEFKREDVATYDEEDYCWYWKNEYMIYKSLYSEISDKQPYILEKIDFDLKILMKVKNVPKPNGFSYDIQKTQWSQNGLTKLTQDDMSYQIIDKLIFPKPLLSQKPCKFTSKQTYDIVRQYIKQHINLEIAEITSDYNFCFTVKKKISLSEPKKYEVDINWSLFSKRKKSKYVTRYKKERLVECFEMTNSEDKYKEYTVITGFEGENQDDLKKKIDIYCKELINFINIPLEDCKNCKGLGVILKNINK